ncbi:uncharacterized protein LOC141909367 [Tubulanus polymorphus]|uniref:uncharacterized protein LOC141909367 n=1 Tax=Tubulanus polymorphus TaxID=672921 RepID=UPI003DA34642
MASFSKLDQPSRKVFIKELYSCRNVEEWMNGDRGNLPLKSWSINRPDKRLELSTVWIQGHVNKVSPEIDAITIDDGSESVAVIGVSKVPQSNQIHSGQYIMVIGSIGEMNLQFPVIEAIKIQDLSQHSSISKSMWMLEIIDAHLYGD